MFSIDTLGFFFVIWGILYILFAFVATQNGMVRSFFRVPGIFVFLPENLILPVGRVISGALFIVVGIFWIVKF